MEFPVTSMRPINYDLLISAAALNWNRRPRATMHDDLVIEAQGALITTIARTSTVAGTELMPRADVQLAIRQLIDERFPEPIIDTDVSRLSRSVRLGTELNLLFDVIATSDFSEPVDPILLRIMKWHVGELQSRPAVDDAAAAAVAEEALAELLRQFNERNENDLTASDVHGRFIIASNNWWEAHPEKL